MAARPEMHIPVPSSLVPRQRSRQGRDDEQDAPCDSAPRPSEPRRGRDAAAPPPPPPLPEQESSQKPAWRRLREAGWGGRPFHWALGEFMDAGGALQEKGDTSPLKGNIIYSVQPGGP